MVNVATLEVSMLHELITHLNSKLFNEDVIPVKISESVDVPE
jgi:hypothetical protein